MGSWTDASSSFECRLAHKSQAQARPRTPSTDWPQISSASWPASLKREPIYALLTRVEGLTICGGVISPPLAVIPSTCHHTPPFALIPTGANTRKPDAKIRTKRTTHRPQQGEYPTRRAFAKRVPHKTSTPLGEQPDNRNPPGWRTSRAENVEHLKALLSSLHQAKHHKVKLAGETPGERP